MDNDRLEILMGKFFDGEIEPSEQRLLESQLGKDPQSRRLFDEFQTLHTMALAEIAPLAQTGKTFESVFTAAWKQSRRGQHRFVRAPIGIVRFMSGMAAGLLLAFLVQFSMRPVVSQDMPMAANPTPTANHVSNGPDRVLTRAAPDAASPLINDVDYYYYTDETGRQWLIEGYRENIKTQLVSYQDM